MITLGPFTGGSLTTPVQIPNIPQDTFAVKIRNDSQHDLFVSFRVSAPPTNGGQSSGMWDETVAAGDSMGITIPAYALGTTPIGSNSGDYLPFIGSLWLFAAVQTPTNLLGSIYLRDAIYITCYQQGDRIPTVQASASRWAALVGQPRVIALLVPPNQPPITGFGTVASINGTIDLGSVDPGGVFPRTLYIHSMSFTGGNSGAGTVRSSWQLYTAAAGSLATPITKIATFELWFNDTNGTGMDFSPSSTAPWTIGMTGGSVIHLVLQCTGASAFPALINYNVLFSNDSEGQIPGLGSGLAAGQTFF